MADEQYRWLDRETAERLLRGESLDAVDAASRDEAERLAKTLGALSAHPAPIGAELPGEAAALAAFRAARTESFPADAGRASINSPESMGRTADAGVVRIGVRSHRGTRRPRWARPARLALSAALAVGMVGGVAVAAGTGVLPTPFGGAEPGPAASVPDAVTSDRPLVSPPPNGPEAEATPDGAASGSAGRDSSRGTAGKGATPGSGSDDRGRQGVWGGARSACKDVRDGRKLSGERLRKLEDMAGGTSRVRSYCKDVLDNAAGAQNGSDDDNGKGDSGRPGNEGGQGDQGGQGDGDGGGDGRNGITRGGGHHHPEGAAAPSPSPYEPPLTGQPTASPAVSPSPTPSPSYTAL